MAYSRSTTSKQVKGDSLDAFVQNLNTTYSKQIAVRNAEDELNFNRLVLENNISLDEQLDYRKKQLTRTTDDPDERKRIKGEISSLADRIEQKKFTDDYTNKLIDFEAGVSSVDTVLDWLKDYKSKTTDQNIIDSINKQIVEKEGTRYNLVKQTVENQSNYAVNSKEISVIDDQIGKVTSSRNQALLSGDQLLVSSYDLQLQALKKAKNETAIAHDLTNFAVSAISGYTTSLGLLDAYNSKISTSGYDGPVTVGGTTYNSAREYWTYKRDSYLSDNSSSGFFDQFSKEVDNKIKVANSQNTLSTGALSDFVSAYDNLSSRSDLAAYSNQIQTYKQSSLQSGANLVSSTLYNKYATDYDINAVLGGLNSLKGLGVNVDDTYTKVIQTGSQLKNTQVSNILSVASDLMATGLTPEQAVAQAIAQGAGATISPTEAVNKSEKDIATGMATGYQNQSFGTDTRLTAGATTGAPAATTGMQTYQYVDKNGALKSIQAASANEALAKASDRATNSGVQLMPSTATPSTTSPQASTAAKTTTNATVNPTPTPAPAPTPAKTTTTTPTPTPTTATPVPPATPAPTKSIGSTYKGVSVVDFLNLAGQDSSYGNRSKLATQYGITGYTGTAAQNTQLLNILKTKY